MIGDRLPILFLLVSNFSCGRLLWSGDVLKIVGQKGAVQFYVTLRKEADGDLAACFLLTKMLP